MAINISKPKAFWLMAGALLVMVVAGGYLGLRMILPINPKLPYFSEERYRIPGLKWHIGLFQPMYLYTFTKGEKDFIKVAYRDINEKVMVMDVLVADRGEKKLNLVRVQNLSNTHEVEKVSDYGSYFKIGDRIVVSYLRKITGSMGSGDEQGKDPYGAEAVFFCEEFPNDCYAVESVFTRSEDYWNFALTGRLPPDLILAALGLSVSRFPE